MSLNWSKQKIFTSNQFNKYLPIKPFDLKRDEVVPQKLRESLISVDANPTQKSLVTIAEKGEDDEDSWEIVGDCTTECKHSKCPFRDQDVAEIFIASPTRPSSSKTSLLRVVSSMSMFDSTAFERRSFLCITRVIPVRNHSAIIHWNIKSMYGVQGFVVGFGYFNLETRDHSQFFYS